MTRLSPSLRAVGTALVLAVSVQAASAAVAEPRHHHRHNAVASHMHHGRHIGGYAEQPIGRASGPYRASGPVPYGAYGATAVEGAPPDNAYDPTRPYGGQAAITAPPGTAAFDIQRQQRQDFCEFSPSRC